jgi:lipopolysaccharide transport system ATP-binding protein
MPIIEVNHVTKEYQLGQLQSLKTAALNQWRRLTGQPVENRPPFRALDDVSFNIEAGEVIGIIGHNGAGKSTLLKLLANISKPSSGNITVKGKVAPLIEVGAGLVGDLTGRENIYLNGAILGIPKAEIKRKFDDIVAFAELEEFIDTPIKRYSSGMSVRLGFAIATSVESDILIVDEVLAVGDLAFQRKCFDRMEDLIKRQGKTVLLVSHNIRQVERICNRVIHLKKGRVALNASTSEACDSFYKESNEKIIQEAAKRNHSNIQGTGELDLIDVRIINQMGQDISEIASGDPLIARVRFKLNHSFDFIELFVGTHRTDFLYLTVASSTKYFGDISYGIGEHEIEYHLPTFPLSPGTYSVRFAAHTKAGRSIFNGESLKTFVVQADTGRTMNPTWNILDLETNMRHLY